MTVNDLAKMIDHSLLHPTMTDEDLREGCQLAKAFDVASVCIKPYAVAQATQWLQGSDVLVGTVIGFPHGNSSIDIKVKETERACQDGAKEIDMVVNVGRVLSGEWDYVRNEIAEVLAMTHQYDASGLNACAVRGLYDFGRWAHAHVAIGLSQEFHRVIFQGEARGLVILDDMFRRRHLREHRFRLAALFRRIHSRKEGKGLARRFTAHSPERFAAA